LSGDPLLSAGLSRRLYHPGLLSAVSDTEVWRSDEADGDKSSQPHATRVALIK